MVDSSVAWPSGWLRAPRGTVFRWVEASVEKRCRGARNNRPSGQFDTTRNALLPSCEGAQSPPRPDPWLPAVPLAPSCPRQAQAPDRCTFNPRFRGCYALRASAAFDAIGLEAASEQRGEGFVQTVQNMDALRSESGFTPGAAPVVRPCLDVASVTASTPSGGAELPFADYGCLREPAPTVS